MIPINPAPIIAHVALIGHSIFIHYQGLEMRMVGPRSELLAHLELRLKRRLLRIQGEKGNNASRYSHYILVCYRTIL